MRMTSLANWLGCAGVIAGSLALSAAEPQFAEVLEGTQRLMLDQPLDEAMVAGIDRFALREIEAAAAARPGLWRRDVSSREAYEKSLEPYRAKLQEIIGAVDPRIAGRGLEDLSLTDLAGLPVAGSRAGNPDTGDLYSIAPCRWQVLEGVTGEGILLHPMGEEIMGLAVVIPDAAWTAEEFCGADPDKPESSTLPRRLAAEGFLVVIPQLISRDLTHAGVPSVGLTNQTHREWVYRSAFELGRHVIGYEVLKVLSAVDAFEDYNRKMEKQLPICVLGVGEGGLIALSSAAIDPRIQATLVSGYFQDNS